MWVGRGVSKMNISDLLSVFDFHDMPVNYINIDKESKDVTLNIDYFVDNKGGHADSVSNIDLHFQKCLLLEYEGDADFINYKNSNTYGVILLVEQYVDSNYTQQGMKIFIQSKDYEQKIDKYLILKIIPKSVSVKV